MVIRLSPLFGIGVTGVGLEPHIEEFKKFLGGAAWR